MATTSFASATTVNFDSLPVGSSVSNFVVDNGSTKATYNKGAIYDSSIDGVTARPAFTNGNYLSVGISPEAQVGPATVSFSNPVNYYGFLWGSIDAYNTVLFDLMGGTQNSVSFTGDDILFPADGIQGKPAYFNFFATGAETIRNITFLSSNNAFETANHAFSVSSVPEPETYALMLAGLGLMGAVARRRKAKQA